MPVCTSVACATAIKKNLTKEIKLQKFNAKFLYCTRLNYQIKLIYWGFLCTISSTVSKEVNTCLIREPEIFYIKVIKKSEIAAAFN